MEDIICGNNVKRAGDGGNDKGLNAEIGGGSMFAPENVAEDGHPGERQRARQDRDLGRGAGSSADSQNMPDIAEFSSSATPSCCGPHTGIPGIAEFSSSATPSCCGPHTYVARGEPWNRATPGKKKIYTITCVKSNRGDGYPSMGPSL